MTKLNENFESRWSRRFSRMIALPVLVAGISASVPAASAVDMPLIKVVKVAYHPYVPYGGLAMFGYSVTNPGTVPLSNVTIADDKCQPITIAFGDTNGNALLDPSESWQYACTALALTASFTNTVTVTATGNGSTATATATANVTVGPAPITVPTIINIPIPKLPNTGIGTHW